MGIEPAQPRSPSCRPTDAVAPRVSHSPARREAHPGPPGTPAEAGVHADRCGIAAGLRGRGVDHVASRVEVGAGLDQRETNRRPAFPCAGRQPGRRHRARSGSAAGPGAAPAPLRLSGRTFPRGLPSVPSTAGAAVRSAPPRAGLASSSAPRPRTRRDSIRRRSPDASPAAEGVDLVGLLGEQRCRCGAMRMPLTSSSCVSAARKPKRTSGSWKVCPRRTGPSSRRTSGSAPQDMVVGGDVPVAELLDGRPYAGRCRFGAQLGPG